jgi:transcription elongation factor Elf1
MTPKEKAEELIEKYIQYSQLEIGYQGITSRIQSAKKCALIAVDELIELSKDTDGYYKWTDFYHEVKQEIEKL